MASAAALVLLLWLAAHTSAWRAVDVRFFDLWTVLTAPGKTDLPVVILAIDEPSFAQLQRPWPFPRRWHAQLLQRLHEDGARAVGLDIVFAEPSTPEDDQALAQAIALGTPVVLAALRERTDSDYGTQWSEVLPIAPLLQAGAIAGQAGVDPDEDFVVRRRPSGGDRFSWQLAQAARLPLPAHPEDQAPLLAYVGPRGSFDTHSYAQALEPGLLPAGFFRDKIVLVGRAVRSATTLDAGSADMFNAPFALLGGADRLMPGVELQANLLANAVRGDGLHPLREWIQLALAVTLMLTLRVLTARLTTGWGVALALGLGAGSLGLSLALFMLQRLWWPPLLPLLALALGFALDVLQRLRQARQRAQQVRQMFAQYVPPEVVKRLIDDPSLLRLGGQSCTLTLLFTDLAGFTQVSERLSPGDTVRLLTDYFNTLTDIVHQHGGTVDKFIGDAVMAFWGAPLPDPQQAQHAFDAACAMQHAMGALNTRLGAQGLPALAMRIGVHTGEAVVGNVGSRSRFSYTAIGDTVNLASRLEGANKAFGSTLLLSQDTAHRLAPETALRWLADVVVKGKTQPMAVYTPCPDAALRTHAQAIQSALAAQQWDAAQAACAHLLAHHPDDVAAQRLRQHMHQRASPPDWTPALPLDKL
ncbi:MAG: adenylate/guanylate cyclase domain-containing protein [Rhodoferax sp.]